MNRFIQWVIALLSWGERPGGRPADDRVASLRTIHRGKIEAFNRALAAAANLRVLLHTQCEELRAREARLGARLRAASASSDEAIGARLALELQNVASDLADLERRLDEADRNANELQMLRDSAIAAARADLREISDVADHAHVDPPPSEKSS
jgi:hypothetical protein